GTGAFPTHTMGAAGNTPQGIAAGDFNGDGLPDLVAVNEGGGANVYLSARRESGTTVVTPAPGNHNVLASYSTDAARIPSQSSTVSLLVLTATTTTLAGTPNPSAFGQSVTLTATVAPASAGSPFGTVDFFNGAANIGTGNVDAVGVATLSLTTL